MAEGTEVFWVEVLDDIPYREKVEYWSNNKELVKVTEVIAAELDHNPAAKFE